MNEWIIRGIFAVAGAAAYKLAEVALQRLRTKNQAKEAPVEAPPVEAPPVVEAPVEVVT